MKLRDTGRQEPETEWFHENGFPYPLNYLRGILTDCMPEEVLFKSEQRMSREQIASYLQTVVDKLNSGEPVTLQAGGDSVTLDPPAQPTFEVKAEREGPTNGPKELSIEFELEWPEDGDDGGELEIG
jgi:amphi-Trp domain-containing protein